MPIKIHPASRGASAGFKGALQPPPLPTFSGTGVEVGPVVGATVAVMATGVGVGVGMGVVVGGANVGVAVGGTGLGVAVGGGGVAVGGTVVGVGVGGNGVGVEVSVVKSSCVVTTKLAKKTAVGFCSVTMPTMLNSTEAFGLMSPTCTSIRY